MHSPEPLFKHVAYTYTLELGGFAGFGTLYGICDIVTSLHAYRVPMHTTAELAIPFVPWMTVAYASLYLMFLIVPFVLRTRREVHALFFTMWAEVAVAVVCYLALPVEPAFPQHPDAGPFRALFEAVDGINMTYNLFPSIHVAFAATAALVLVNRGVRGAILLVWSAAVIASTVLTHQHHVADVAGGLVLACLCVRYIYDRRC